MTAPPPASPTAWRLAAAGALLALALAAAYLPLGRNGFVNFDDDSLILDNPVLRDLSADGVAAILERQVHTPHYKPLVNLSWAAELRLFGPNPRVFHRHNLLLHLLNTLLVLGLAVRLAGRGQGRHRRLLAATAVAAIWALHPLKVESVAWAAERKDVLFAAFYLGAMLAYLRWVDGRRPPWLALSVVLFLGGVLAKSTAITLPLALLLIDLLRRRRPRPGLVLEKLPHLAVVALALYLWGLLPGPGEAGASLALLAGHGPAARLAGAAHRHLAFAAHWLLPFDLAIIYPIPGFLARPAAARLAAYAVAHLALLAALGFTLRRSRRAAAAMLFFTVTLLPTLAAPISATNYLSDRYLYLPSLGLTALVVLAAGALCRRLPSLVPALAAGGAAVAVLLGLLTYRQVGVWRDGERLWDHALAVQPPNPIAYNNRGAALRLRGDHRAALADFNRALALRPDYAEALANRGDLLRRGGAAAEGLADLDEAVHLRPDDARIYRRRGLAHAALGSLPRALADYTRALELDPTDAESYHLRAQAHRLLGDLAAAQRDSDRALARLDRPSASGHLLRALILAGRGDLEGALAATTSAVELGPDNPVALNNRGFVQLRLGRPEAALVDLDRALALRPGYALALRTRGDALAQLGRRRQACDSWRRAQAGGAPAAGRRLAACSADPTAGSEPPPPPANPEPP